MLGVRLGRGTAPYYATGTGSGQPEGLVTGATLGVTTASATAITFDELVQLQHKIDPAYRSQPGCGWLMHDLIMSYIRRIKDSSNRPLWTNGEFYASGIREGVPDKFLGWPVNVCQELDSAVTTTKKTVFGGLLSKYKVRTVDDVRMYRLVERYRDYDQDGFIAFLREDGKLLDAGTAPVQYIQQA
jgi:HK97 family phage major capsid protein